MTSPAWRHAAVAALLLGACTTAGDAFVAGDQGPSESVTTVTEATTPPAPTTTAPAPPESTVTATPEVTTTTTTPATTTTTAGPTATTTPTTTTTTVDLSGLDDALDELEGLLDELNTIETEGELP